LQRFGISPHLDGVDPFGIHGVGRDGDVQAPVEFAGARDEVTEGSDPGVALLGADELVASDDDRISLLDVGSRPWSAGFGGSTVMAVEFGGPAVALSGPSNFCPSAMVTVQGHGWPDRADGALPA
jgi:hypothetical protein